MAGGEDRRVALLSIHPRFARAILAGEKTVELRRTAFSSDVEAVLLYATAPVQAIVGWFRVAGIVRDRPTRIWKRHGPGSSLTRTEFMAYFEGADLATAILIGDVGGLDDPVSLDAVRVTTPPQSFSYPPGRASGLVPPVGAEYGSVR